MLIEAALVLMLGAVPWDSQCTATQRAAGLCATATTDGSTVTVGGSITEPGGSRSEGGRDTGPRSDANTRTEESGDAAEEDCGLCRVHYEVVVFPDVTIDDLASFAPAAPSFTGEPAGVGVVGMPTNLVVTASAHVAHGVLFDFPVAVRFTPRSFVLEHGDGTRRETRSGGRTWSALGQAQFSATPTSHAYAARGTYTARATVRYTAQVDLGRGWFDVPGILSLTSPGYTVRIVEVHTALVDRTCAEDPTGPGC